MGSVGNNYKEFSSEVCRGDETTVICSLKGWNEMKKEDDLHILLHDCIVNLEGGEGPASRLRFYFEEKTITVKEPAAGRNGYFDVFNTECLALMVEQLFKATRQSVHYEIQVDLVDAKLNVVTHDSISADVETTFRPGANKSTQKGPLKMDFVKVFLTVTDTFEKTSSSKEYPRLADLRLKISVTPFYLRAEEQTQDGGLESPTREDASLCQALKNLFVAEVNYADLKLVMKDNSTLGAHKFILAARSPILGKLIEKERKKGEDFCGTIKLLEVNAKPMAAILHWMYTGELHENAGKFLEEVVEAATRFKLVDLIKILDQKLISICNANNMLQLYATAKKNGMVTAMADIKQFIKENL